MTKNNRDQDVEFIQALAELLRENDLTELEVRREYGEDDSLDVRVSRATTVVQAAAPAPVAAAAPVAAPAAPAALPSALPSTSEVSLLAGLSLDPPTAKKVPPAPNAMHTTPTKIIGTIDDFFSSPTSFSSAIIFPHNIFNLECSFLCCRSSSLYNNFYATVPL